MNLQFDSVFFVDLAGIAVMLYGLAQILSLRKKVPGGMVGRYWRALTALVAMFMLGYLATPFFALLPPNSIRMIVALVFLFGAIYVALTVRLLYRIIEELA